MKQLVIMPGGFHPFHAGHLALYQSAVQAFPGADVKVAATNDTSDRPFPFALKEKMAQLAGVPPGNFYQVNSPFRAEEITKNYDPATTQLIFVRSEKDQGKSPMPAAVDPATGQLPLVTRGANKGKPVSNYLQYYSGNEDQPTPMTQHAYMAYLPTVEFGPGMTSATEIRSAWPTLNEKRKTALVMSLYPKTQANPKLAATVVKMLDTAIGTQDVAEGSNKQLKEGAIRVAGVMTDLQAKTIKDPATGGFIPADDFFAKYPDKNKQSWETALADRLDPAKAKANAAAITAAYDKQSNDVSWMTPEEQAQYKQLAAKDQAATQATGTRTTYGAERYLKQLFQQKMDAKKAAAMLKVHWAPLTQLESFLQGKVNNKIELSAYLAPNAESLGKTRWGGGSFPTVGIVLDGHITIGGRGDLGSDIIDAVPGQRRQQKYASRPGQIDPTLSMDTSVHHEVLVDNWKIKEIVLPADIPLEIDSLVQQYKIPVRRLGNPQAVAEAGKRFVDPELAKAKQYAKQHYPGMADPESAFDKWVTRSLMHSDRDDHDQDKRLQQLAADIAAVKTKIQALQQNADYLDESR